MLDWARAIHEAIPDPRLFIAIFALVGLLLFGAVGWMIDRGYQVKRREQNPPALSAPSVQIQQQSGGPNSPVTAVVGTGNIVTVNPLPAERTLDDAAAARIVARIIHFKGQRVHVSAAASSDEAQRLGSRIRDLVIAAGWACPSLVGQAFFGPQPGLPGIVVEASPGTDAAAQAVADALARYSLTGLRLNSTLPDAGFIVINVFPNPR